MAHNKKILLVPLDWGLGHTTRCIPVIKALVQQGFEVIIGGNALTNQVLLSEFPQLSYEELPGYNIHYAKQAKFLPWHMLKQLPKIGLSVQREHQWLKEMHAKYHLHAVISDNRYGLYHEGIISVFITHQLHIQVPQHRLLQKLVNRINHHFINKFQAVWIPDLPAPGIAGLLSNKEGVGFHTPDHMRYIGPLSRFSLASEPKAKDIDILFILSGPEPQRSLLEEKILAEFKQFPARMVMVRGLPQSQAPLASANLTIYNHADAETLNDLILRSKHIVSRAGYSSIMDYLALNTSALLIPTPGQTEQEYLADYLSQQAWFATAGQEESLVDALSRLKDITPPPLAVDSTKLLQEAILADLE